MDNVHIQIQNVTGTWFTVNTVLNLDTAINTALLAALKTGKRARAVDMSGKVLDIRSS